LDEGDHMHRERTGLKKHRRHSEGGSMGTKEVDIHKGGKKSALGTRIGGRDIPRGEFFYGS